MNRPKYQARLTETGLAIEDSINLCSEFVTSGSWEEVKSKALKDNLLAKGSRSRISKLLRAVERRVFQAPPPLDCYALTARFLAAESKVSSASKSQLLFVLACNEDVALRDAYRLLVIPKLVGKGSRVLDAGEISNFLMSAAQYQPEVSHWTEQTRSRWAQGFRLVLREAGFVSSSDKSASVEIRTPVVRDEVVSFLAHAIADSGGNGWSILGQEKIATLLLTENDALRAARSLNDRGWWSFAQSGRIIEFRRNHASLEEWLNHGLGI